MSKNYQTKAEIGRGPSRSLLLGLGYFLLAIMVTWPTITHLATHLPGDGGDDPAIAWNLWWVKQALLNEGQNPFQTDFMFYPLGLNLAFYTLTVLNAATALPLTLNFGVVTASNLHLLFTFVTGGYGAFLLARHVLTQNSFAAAGHHSSVPGLTWASAAMAGGFYAFASSKLFYVALGQFNIASSHWVPFAVLYVLRARRDPHRLKNPLMAGLFLTLQAWTELTYASFLVIFIALYWIWESAGWAWVYTRRHTLSPFAILSHLRAGLVMGLTFTLGLSPILAQMLPDLRAEGDFLVEGSGFAQNFSADLFGFVIPTLHHPLLGKLVTQTNIQDFTKGQHIYVGFVLLLLALLAGLRRAGLRFWLIAAVLFALLCLGPVITINGHATGLPGPFVLLQNLPLFKGNRYPSRYSVMLILSLSVIAGFTLVQMGRWLGSRSYQRKTSPRSGQRRLRQYAPGIGSIKAYSLLTLVALLFLFEHLSLPLPQSDMRVPAPYQIIAADPDDFTVLDIPLAWRNGFRITGPLTPQFMFGQFYQTAHQKRLLQGNTSRNPEFKFQYFTNAPILNSLLALETGKTLPPERWEADRTIAAGVLRFFNIKYIIVRPFSYDRSDGAETVNVTEQAIIPYIEDVFPVEKIHDEATIIIYRVKDSSRQAASIRPDLESGLQAGLQIATNTPLAPLYFGQGWGLLRPGQPLTAQRRDVRLLLPLSDGPQQITLRMRRPDNYQAAVQRASLELNGWQSPWQTVSQTWQEYRFELPAGVARAGLNEVRLRFSQVASLPPPQSGIVPADVTVLSAGEEVGNFGHIFVNGYEVSPDRRGYNVAIFQPDGSGQSRLATANFDTHLDPAASEALATLIAATPPKALVAMAVADEASRNLSQAAVEALRAVGASGDLRGCFRCSHALISQLQPSGPVLIGEGLDPLRPVGVTTELGLTEPAIAALVDWIRVEPVVE